MEAAVDFIFFFAGVPLGREVCVDEVDNKLHELVDADFFFSEGGEDFLDEGMDPPEFKSNLTFLILASCESQSESGGDGIGDGCGDGRGVKRIGVGDSFDSP